MMLQMTKGVVVVYQQRSDLMEVDEVHDTISWNSGRTYSTDVVSRYIPPG